MWQLFKNSRDRIVIKFAFVTLVTIQLIKKGCLQTCITLGSVISTLAR
jgi:hypothetical protein